MGTKIIVNTGNLVKTSNEITKQADLYKATAANLFNEIYYMSNSWNGKDNIAFVNQINGFKDDFELIDKLLRQYAEMLKIVDKEYRQTLNESYSVANSI